MITELTRPDLSKLSHSKNLKELFESPSEAFLFGFWFPRMYTYITNANLKKRRPELITEIRNIIPDTMCYAEEMKRLEKEYVTDESSILGIANYVLKHLQFNNEDDINKVAFVLGVEALSNLSENH